MVLNTSARVASQVLVFHFPVLLVQPSRETRGQFWSQFLVSPLSRQVLEYVRNQRWIFVLSFSLSVQIRDRQNSS